jgi:DNA modification methylase
MSDKIKLSTLKANPGNPRRISEAKMDALKKSLSGFEQMMTLRPIVVDETWTVLGGNMRLQALKQLGHKEIPREWVKIATDLTEEQKREFIIKDNVGFGEWDWDILGNEWEAEQLVEWGLEVPDWGKEAEAQEDDYEIPDEIKTDFVLGDLIEIGRHRLLCGDSIDADDVSNLLGGKEPYLMVTDPPYGVVYDPTWRHKAGINDSSRTGKVQNDDKADWSEAWALSPARVAYIWHADKHTAVVQQSLEKCEFEIRAQIIWNKQQMVFGRGDYHWKHEPCWYAVKKGNKGNWAGDRKQTTVWDIQSILQSSKKKQEDAAQVHGTQKPVECMARPIGNHDGDVYDPFLGSGTTMVACHQLGRICYGMELDPKYCQVIVDRMVKFDPDIEVKVNGKVYIKQSDE